MREEQIAKCALYTRWGSWWVVSNKHVQRTRTFANTNSTRIFYWLICSNYCLIMFTQFSIVFAMQAWCVLFVICLLACSPACLPVGLLACLLVLLLACLPATLSVCVHILLRWIALLSDWLFVSHITFIIEFIYAAIIAFLYAQWSLVLSQTSHFTLYTIVYTFQNKLSKTLCVFKKPCGVQKVCMLSWNFLRMARHALQNIYYIDLWI